MTDSPPPDALKNLLIFVIVLAVVATIIALIIHFGVILPAEAGHPPANRIFTITCSGDPSDSGCNSPFR